MGETRETSEKSETGEKVFRLKAEVSGPPISDLQPEPLVFSLNP
jgi:hypothetical protein